MAVDEDNVAPMLLEVVLNDEIVDLVEEDDWHDGEKGGGLDGWNSVEILGGGLADAGEDLGDANDLFIVGSL